jgi:hypothetical protein
MSLLTENQLTDIVDMIVDDYGSRLIGSEVSEVIGLILENISGFETVDSQALTKNNHWTSQGSVSPFLPAPPSPQNESKLPQRLYWLPC